MVEAGFGNFKYWKWMWQFLLIKQKQKTCTIWIHCLTGSWTKIWKRPNIYINFDCDCHCVNKLPSMKASQASKKLPETLLIRITYNKVGLKSFFLISIVPLLGTSRHPRGSQTLKSDDDPLPSGHSSDSLRAELLKVAEVQTHLCAKFAQFDKIL